MHNWRALPLMSPAERSVAIPEPRLAPSTRKLASLRPSTCVCTTATARMVGVDADWVTTASTKPSRKPSDGERKSPTTRAVSARLRPVGADLMKSRPRNSSASPSATPIHSRQAGREWSRKWKPRPTSATR